MHLIWSPDYKHMVLQPSHLPRRSRRFSTSTGEEAGRVLSPGWMTVWVTWPVSSNWEWLDGVDSGSVILDVDLGTLELDMAFLWKI